MKKTFNYITNGLMYGIVALTCLVFILSAFGIKPYITMSGSMEPNIQTGSICFVNLEEKYENIEVNDIIAFKTGSTLVTHRVHDITDDGIITKGDNNEKPDTFVTNEANFAGKTLFSIPYIGYAVMFVKKPASIMTILCVLLILLFINLKDLLFPPKNKSAD